MPVWAQRINIINPLAHFMKVIRMIMLKGSALRDVMDDFLFIVVSAVAVILAAIIRYRKNEL
jgi:ABC-2 type transport system permease protein